MDSADVTSPAATGALLDHLFRRQAGRMVAHLVRLLGPPYLSLAEEAVQQSMVRALEVWPYQGVPEKPEAWLFRVAHNSAIDTLRRYQFIGARTQDIVAALGHPAAPDPAHPGIEEHLRDDELRMIFMCCHPEIARDSAVTLSLKVCCGFSIREIARAFLAEESAIAQRIVRARRQIQERRLSLDMPRGPDLELRLDAVLEVLYFLFNEGYTAHEGDTLIRRDLCLEALRLARLVAGSSLNAPRVDALVALMALQVARMPARTDDAGELILLDEQDRGRWDQQLIALGFEHFDRSIAGDTASEYHVQAAIAATHARSSNDWPLILELYDQLLALNDSPVVRLNRAVAVAKVRGAAEALASIEPLRENAKLREYYLLMALRGHLLSALGRGAEAAEAFRAALECRCSEPERRFLERKCRQRMTKRFMRSRYPRSETEGGALMVRNTLSLSGTRECPRHLPGDAMEFNSGT